MDARRAAQVVDLMHQILAGPNTPAKILAFLDCADKLGAKSNQKSFSSVMLFCANVIAEEGEKANYEIEKSSEWMILALGEALKNANKPKN